MTRRTVAALVAAVPLVFTPALATASPTSPAPTRDQEGPASHRLPHTATMTGSGGAVASVDPVASQVGIDVLAEGGTAADAAVAATAALNVVEPYATGIGGGGFLVYYDAKTKEVTTIDGRETAPASMNAESFLQADGTPMDFDEAVNSGLSVGVPGTPATWEKMLDRWGQRSLSDNLAPAQQIARRGFVVDEAFTTATEENAERFAQFPATAEIFLPGGSPVQPGDVLRQPDLARTLGILREEGTGAVYGGQIGKAIVATVNEPVTVPGVTVPSGGMTVADLLDYRAVEKEPVVSRYQGMDVYGMPVPSSGGIAVAQILNLLEEYEKRTGVALKDTDDVQYYHRLAEATATAFADRNRWVGDVPEVPAGELTSQEFAAERACGFDPAKAAARPIPFGEPDGDYAACAAAKVGEPATVSEGAATTHLTVADKWGNVAAYTTTIEQFGGSGMVLPGYGFLLNNELTDFNMEPATKGVPDPNLPAPGKRPRSAISPTIIMKDDRPILALGAAGGATITTTTAQIITQYLDRGRTLVGALDTPRLSSRNTAATVEPELLESATGQALAALGQPLTPAATISRATAIAMPARGWFTGAAEPERGGGGSAMVVKPRG